MYKMYKFTEAELDEALKELGVFYESQNPGISGGPRWSSPSGGYAMRPEEARDRMQNAFNLLQRKIDNSAKT